ncbi:MAG: hypothetical protein A2428_16010 [Bdellovibrionales bacterium RIFOXYC1_FULL_54_43]|nr:MAG: hypothetical protein A2428_16010 [Bdellovibrionales bacterium RIFOXYC1_FULL_54_43]OFZ85165.1 MAG: hypothetical protein A2603_06335 [Bdellovibrionales bacterium RIFOXYD1_FULL_55_31]
MRSNSLISDDEKALIESTLLDAEKTTLGEIVPIVVRRSDTYPGARWSIGFACALLSAAILYGLNPSLNPLWYLVIQLPGLLFGHGIANISSVQRFFLSDSLIDEEVHQRALEAFYLNNLNATRERTGILIFVSILEHRVEILADSGINAKAPAGTWDEIVRELTNEIRQGKLTDGMCAAILKCGKILTHHFPAHHENLNELPNKLLIED